MTKCNRCGSEDVAWGDTKKGTRALYDTKHLHFISCKARPKAAPVLAELRSLGMTADEAKRFKAKHRGSDDDIIMAALKEMGR